MSPLGECLPTTPALGTRICNTLKGVQAKSPPPEGSKRQLPPKEIWSWRFELSFQQNIYCSGLISRLPCPRSEILKIKASVIETRKKPLKFAVLEARNY